MVSMINRWKALGLGPFPRNQTENLLLSIEIMHIYTGKKGIVFLICIYIYLSQLISTSHALQTKYEPSLRFLGLGPFPCNQTKNLLLSIEIMHIYTNKKGIVFLICIYIILN